MTDKHTAEPWQCYQPSEFPNDIRLAKDTKVVSGEWNNGYIARLTYSHTRPPGWSGDDGSGYANPRMEDAQRIVACVNACAGVPLNVIEAGRRELQEWLNTYWCEACGAKQTPDRWCQCENDE